MIQRIYADNFRCLGNFELRPGQMNLLLGENGSGKTSLLEVLQHLRDLVVGGGAGTLTPFAFTKTEWDQRSLQSFEIDVKTAEGAFSYRLEIQQPTAAQSPPESRIKSELVSFEGKPLFRYSDGQVQLYEDDYSPGARFPFKPVQSFLPHLETQNGKLQTFKAFLARINIFQLNPFNSHSFSQKDEPFLRTDGHNFASWLRYLSQEKPGAKAECEERLGEIIAGFQRFRFQTVGDHKLLLAEFTREGGGGYELPFSRLSEGHRILSMLYAILYGMADAASVLCFDEPENFISMPEVQPWLQCLRDLTEERDGQVLLISHHPEVIDYLAADSAFRFERPNGDLTRVREWMPEPGEIERSSVMRPSEILIRGGE